MPDTLFTDTYGFADDRDHTGAFVRAVAEKRRAEEEAAKASGDAAKRATAAAERQAQRVKELTDRYGRYADTVQKAAARNQQLAKSLSDGTYARHAADLARINREHRALERQAQLTSLVAEHGRWGAALKASSGHLATLHRAAGFAVGGVTALTAGLVRSGLQGTVEGYRLEYAWTRLSRQVAAVAVPAIEKVTGWVTKAAGWFERLNGAQQDNVLKWGLIAGGALLVGGALRTIVTVGGAAVGVLRAVSLTGRTAAAAGAAAQTGGLAAAMAAASAKSGAAVGGGAAAAAGGGFLARNMGTLRAGGLAIGGAALAGVGLAMNASTDDNDPRVRTLAQRHPELAGKSEFELRRMAEDARKGESGIGNFAKRTAGRIGAGAWDLAAYVTGSQSRRDDFRPDSDVLFAMADEKKRAGQNKRRDVTPLQVAQEEAGGGHFRIQEELLKVTVARADEERERKAALDAMLELTVALNDAATVFEKIAQMPADGSERGLVGNVSRVYADMLADMRRASRRP